LQASDYNQLRLGDDPSVRHLDNPCLLVKRPWYRNFGHWLLDGAALLAVVGDHVRRIGWSVVIGFYDDPVMQRVVRETLECLVPDVPILQQPHNEVWQ
jgi:hypothetical protein